MSVLRRVYTFAIVYVVNALLGGWLSSATAQTHLPTLDEILSTTNSILSSRDHRSVKLREYVSSLDATCSNYVPVSILNAILYSYDGKQVEKVLPPLEELSKNLADDTLYVSPAFRSALTSMIRNTETTLKLDPAILLSPEQRMERFNLDKVIPSDLDPVFENLLLVTPTIELDPVTGKVVEHLPFAPVKTGMVQIPKDVKALLDNNLINHVDALKAIYALDVGQADAVTALVDIIKSQPLGVSDAAAIRLGEIGEKAIEPIITLLQDDTLSNSERKVAVFALIRINKPDARALNALTDLSAKSSLSKSYAEEALNFLKATSANRN